MNEAVSKQVAALENLWRECVAAGDFCLAARIAEDIAIVQKRGGR